MGFLFCGTHCTTHAKLLTLLFTENSAALYVLKVMWSRLLEKNDKSSLKIPSLFDFQQSILYLHYNVGRIHLSGTE